VGYPHPLKAKTIQLLLVATYLVLLAGSYGQQYQEHGDTAASAQAIDRETQRRMAKSERYLAERKQLIARDPDRAKKLEYAEAEHRARVEDEQERARERKADLQDSVRHARESLNISYLWLLTAGTLAAYLVSLALSYYIVRMRKAIQALEDGVTSRSP